MKFKLLRRRIFRGHYLHSMLHSCNAVQAFDISKFYDINIVHQDIVKSIVIGFMRFTFLVRNTDFNDCE